MAINDIKTAGEAKVVARELERIATNGTMLILMMALDPEMRDKVGLLAQFLKGLSSFAVDLKEAAHGLEDDAEVFETTQMSMKGVEGLGALDDFFGSLPK